MSDANTTDTSPHLPLLEESMEFHQGETTPSWRGVIHLAILPVAIIAGIVLIVLADGVAATMTSAIFAVSSWLLFGISGTYHRFTWGPKAKVILKRLDHANIFLLIAGTYTPIAWLALPHDKAVFLLSLIWGGALLGIGFRVFWIHAPRWLYVPIYLGLGWAAVLYIDDLFAANLATMILVIVGGLAYSLGAIVYGLKRPNPIPAHFGFHEIFHVLTVVAFLSHWTAVLLMAIDPPLVG
ncbi:hemolysin III family protein [Pontimonas sp.]|nr:hemolysin III family protein [Pontimonas sp.]